MSKLRRYPRVGIGIFIWQNKKFLMGKRKGAHGNDTWSVPGGHLEFGETIEQGAKREAAEEIGVGIKNVRIVAVTNDIFKKEDKHYVTVWVQSDLAKGKASITEPDKFISIKWVDFNSLPRPLFLPWRQLKKARPDLFN